MDRSQTTSYHHNIAGPTICLEKYNMPIWGAEDHHNQ